MSTGSSYLLRGEERQRMWLMASSSEMFRFLMLLSLVATSPQSVSANLKIPTTAPSSNLFNEYITRGLFTCTRDYVKSLTDLHVLMRELYENYQSCKQQVKDVDKTYPQTPFAYLNDLMRRYQMADKPKDMKDIEKEIVAGAKKTSL
uniref:Secreted protein n=1 Tax=Ascaris lumbricoides TaxID=6252 RepID=A0A0M3I024_ASCLU